MLNCKNCRADAPSGSGFCPRCGIKIDDGLGRRQLYRRVVAAIVVGVTALILLDAMFVARKTSSPMQSPTVLTEVRKL